MSEKLSADFKDKTEPDTEAEICRYEKLLESLSSLSRFFRYLICPIALILSLKTSNNCSPVIVELTVCSVSYTHLTLPTKVRV